MRIVNFHRGALVFLLVAWTGTTLAVSGWDCQRGANGKEWVCVSGKKRTDQPAAAKEPPPSTPLKTETRGPEAPIDTARPEEPLPPVQRDEGGKAAQVGPEGAYKLGDTVRATVAQSSLSSGDMGRQARGTPASGWSCRPTENRAWDCTLVGPDPRGQPHRVGEAGSEAENWARSETMTDQDEQRFKSIMARLPDDPWRLSCGKRKSEITPSTLFLLTDEDRRLRESSPLEIQSDYAELVEGEVSNFKGRADLVRADQRLSGDFVTHNKVSGTLNAQGNVIYREKGLSFAADTGFMRLKSDQGVLRNSQFIIETVPARGTSRLTHIDSKTRSRYESVSYTTCPPGNQDWLLHAETTQIDKETGRGLARNAWLEFKGIPLMWTPFLSFPVDDRRQSGFLTPNFAFTKIGGFDFTVPYYFNLAPNYDATVAFREITNRGQMFRGEFRYLTGMTRGVVGGEYMPYDDVRQESRGLFTFKNDTRFTDRLISRVDLNYVTDARYLNELGNVLHVQNSRFMPSLGRLTYTGDGYTLAANADYYLSVDPTITKSASPYSRLPQLLFTTGQEIGDTGLRFDGLAEMVNFEHRAAQDRVTAQRLNLRPRLYYPLRSSAGYLIPSLALQHTQYWLSWPDTGGLTGQALEDLKTLNNVRDIRNDVSRTAPIFSVDSGLAFDREFQFGQVPWLQTLEPRLFYLYVPKVGHGDIPLFDTAEYDFSFYQLFRENRFSGADRLNDANQITPALTTRFIDQTNGLERLRLSVGEIFHFRDREITLRPTQPANTADKSNLVGEVYSMLTDHWNFRTTGQWDPTHGRIDRGQIALQYNNFRNQLLNLSYRYRLDPNRTPELDQTINQSDVSFRLPFAEGWNVIGRWQYSFQQQLTTETFLGVERETCCWRFSIVALRYLNGVRGGVSGVSSSTGVATAADNQANHGVFFQLEFKGLTRLGNEVDRFLARSISGYRLENEF